MLGIIAFALLLLACSYWKLSGDGGGDNPAGSGDGNLTCSPAEQRIVVIMAGTEEPTFLANPVPSRASSFGECSGRKMVGVIEKEVED